MVVSALKLEHTVSASHAKVKITGFRPSTEVVTLFSAKWFATAIAVERRRSNQLIIEHPLSFIIPSKQHRVAFCALYIIR